jgi:predicted permease
MLNWREVIRRVSYLGRKTRFDDELRDEMRFHIDSRADELEQTGLSRTAALSQATREFGSSARLGEATRGVWQIRWIEDLLADLRYGLRACRRQPLFTLTVAGSIALGIGANSAVLTAVDAVLWRPLRVHDPATLIQFTTIRSNGSENDWLPIEYHRHLRAIPPIADVAGEVNEGLSFTYDGRAERIMGMAVTANYFTMLGVQPAIGQPFSPDVRAGRWAAEAVLSYRFWQRRFGGDPSVIGRTIRLNSYPFTIVGVSASSFFDLVQGIDPEVRVPVLPPDAQLAEIELMNGANASSMLTIARLRPGATMAQAEAAINGRLSEYFDATTSERVRRAPWTRIRVESGARGWTSELDDFHAPLFVLLALSALVLVTACANMASMLSARDSARRRELAIRVSIGAGKLRLGRQLLAEGVLLAVMGGALAVPIAYGTAQMLPQFLPQGHIGLSLDLQPDARAIAFTSVLALVAGCVVGFVTALQATRGDQTGALKSDLTPSVSAGGGATLRRALVTGQVAFSLAMLVVAALFLRAVSVLRPTDFVGPLDRILLFTIKPQRELYNESRMRTLADELVRRMSALPGVSAAAIAETGPLASRQHTTRVYGPHGDSAEVAADFVSPGFFDAAGIRLLSGRAFGAGDSPGAPRVAVINRSLAQLLFGRGNPVGRTIAVPPGGPEATYLVIGVVADVRYHDLRVAPPPTLWRAYQTEPPYMPTLHVRSADANTGALINAVLREFDAIDTGFPVFDIKSLDKRVADTLARERMVAGLATAFGALALMLAAVGLYGVLAFSVTRRTREIGLRIALGSSVRSVLWLVGREAAQLVIVGLVLGAAIALGAARIIASNFAGVSTGDVAVFAASIMVLTLIAAIAVSIPAARAARVDPLEALRTN